MSIRVLAVLPVVVVLAFVILMPCAAAEPAASSADVAVKITLSQKDAKMVELLAEVARQSKDRLVIESSVKGTIPSVEVKDQSVEDVLTVLCKLGKIEWRKVYISPDDKLLEQPDKFASTVRLMSGLSFPDMVLAGSSGGKTEVHLGNKKAIQPAEEIAVKALGMTKVYLITNDTAVAAKGLADEKSKVIDKMGKLAKEQIDTFLKMTPEEREEALVSGLSLMDQIGPDYMNAVMQSMMNIDPEYMHRIMQRQFDALFSMTPEQRRAMMKMQMQAAKFITPEQMQMIQEDAAAIAKEMQENGLLPGN